MTIRSLVAAAMTVLVTFTAPSTAVEFLADGAGNYLTDEHGGRLVILTGAHNVIVHSSWAAPKGVVLSIIAEFADDLSGINVMGYANVEGSTITQTQIETVDAAGTVKLLQTCPGPRCVVFIAKSSMRAGSNDIWLLATTAAGVKYGATTKMSPP